MVYDSETRSLSAQKRRKIGVFEFICLTNICGIRAVDRMRNSVVGCARGECKDGQK